MMALENWLVYPRPKLSAPESWELRYPEQHDVVFEAADGIRLHGWFFAQTTPRHVILVCHGNGEDISHGAGHLAYLRETLGAAILAFDYRGYGKSEGAPDEPGVILDGLAAQRWLAERMQIDSSEIVILGRSLGGAVAVALAEQQGARALILQNTFANLTDVAAEKFFWLPVRWIMRNRYPSAERIQKYSGPLLQTHGRQDRVVPYVHGKLLFDAAPGAPKQWIEQADLGHNDHLPPSYYETLAEFLESLPR